jgi:hypothetical protein
VKIVMKGDCLQQSSYFVIAVGALTKNFQTPVDLGKGR